MTSHWTDKFYTALRSSAADDSDEFLDLSEIVDVFDRLNELDWEQLLKKVIIDGETHPDVIRFFCFDKSLDVISQFPQLITQISTNSARLFGGALDVILRALADASDEDQIRHLTRALKLAGSVSFGPKTVTIQSFVLNRSLPDDVRILAAGALVDFQPAPPWSFWESLDLGRDRCLSNQIFAAHGGNDPEAALRFLNNSSLNDNDLIEAETSLRYCVNQFLTRYGKNHFVRFYRSLTLVGQRRVNRVLQLDEFDGVRDSILMRKRGFAVPAKIELPSEPNFRALLFADKAIRKLKQDTGWSGLLGGEQLSKIRFWSEDHALFTMVAKLKPQEASNILLNRIPSAGLILKQSEELANALKDVNYRDHEYLIGYDQFPQSKLISALIESGLKRAKFFSVERRPCPWRNNLVRNDAGGSKEASIFLDATFGGESLHEKSTIFEYRANYVYTWKSLLKKLFNRTDDNALKSAIKLVLKGDFDKLLPKQKAEIVVALCEQQSVPKSVIGAGGHTEIANRVWELCERVSGHVVEDPRFDHITDYNARFESFIKKEIPVYIGSAVNDAMISRWWFSDNSDNRIITLMKGDDIYSNEFRAYNYLRFAETPNENSKRSQRVHQRKVRRAELAAIQLFRTVGRDLQQWAAVAQRALEKGFVDTNTEGSIRAAWRLLGPTESDTFSDWTFCSVPADVPRVLASAERFYRSS